MSHAHWLEQAEIYALGALDGQERIVMEAHLSEGCAQCEALIAETSAMLPAFSESLKPIAPPAHIRQALMQKISPVAVPAGTGLPLSAMLGAGMLVLSLCVAVSFWNQPVKVAAPAVVHDAKMAEILSEPEVRLVEFKNPETGEKMTAKLYWNPKKCGGCFTVKGLTRLDKGKVYELWALKGDKPVPAGTFAATAGGDAHLDIRSLGETGDFGKFAVTVEPAGGTALPTGPMKLLSF